MKKQTAPQAKAKETKSTPAQDMATRKMVIRNGFQGTRNNNFNSSPPSHRTQLKQTAKFARRKLAYALAALLVFSVNLVAQTNTTTTVSTKTKVGTFTPAIKYVTTATGRVKVLQQNKYGVWVVIAWLK